VPIATRLFVPSAYRPSAKFGAFGMLLFSGQPGGAEDLARYQRICETYLRVLDDSAVVDEVDPHALQMVTVWPRADLKSVRSFDPETGNAHDECQRAIAHYAYASAHIWMKKFETHGAQFPVARGPYLVAWSQRAAAKKSSVVLTLDLSTLDSTPEIENAFRLWGKQIEDDPRHWQSSWRPTDWKFYTASMLNTYGQRIIDALAIVKHAGFIS
jgi:hypothetical protein